MFDCLIHSKDKQEAANSKHLFSRVCGNIFATSTELYVYRNVYYTLELRENINKSTQPKKVCAIRRVLMRRLSQLTNSIKSELGNLITLVYFWIFPVFIIQHDLKFFIRDLLCAKKIYWWITRYCSCSEPLFSDRR